jgi:hypothetical protein
MENGIVSTYEFNVVASAVKTYVRYGWIPKEEGIEYKEFSMQETEHNAVKSENKDRKTRQKSWIPWPKSISV